MKDRHFAAPGSFLDRGFCRDRPFAFEIFVLIVTVFPDNRLLFVRDGAVRLRRRRGALGREFRPASRAEVGGMGEFLAAMVTELGGLGGFLGYRSCFSLQIVGMFTR